MSEWRRAGISGAGFVRPTGVDDVLSSRDCFFCATFFARLDGVVLRHIVAGGSSIPPGSTKEGEIMSLFACGKIVLPPGANSDERGGGQEMMPV